jgi:hypothetical protein
LAIGFGHIIASTMRRAIQSLLLMASLLTAAPIATAKASLDSGYGFDRTWNAALRMIRVDMAFKVTEKDDQNGYLLFEYRSSEGGKKATSGSLELVRGEGDHVKVLAQLPQMPSYHEQVLVDSLSRKLRAEFGDAPSHGSSSKGPNNRSPDAGAPDSGN